MKITAKIGDVNAEMIKSGINMIVSTNQNNFLDKIVNKTWKTIAMTVQNTEPFSTRSIIVNRDTIANRL